jgi:hypothetical protein
VLRREYEEDMARSGRVKTFGWCGSFLKCLDVANDRPFLVDVMVHKFGKREYGYKDIEVSSGPYDINLAAARWLRRELDKRGIIAEKYEADWLLSCERAERASKELKAIQPGSVIAAKRDFELNNGTKFKAGDTFDVKSVKRGKVYCTPQGVSWPYMRLSSWIFAPRRHEDYPLMVV